MFRSRKSWSLGVSGLAVVILAFQNCALDGSFESAEMSSETKIEMDEVVHDFVAPPKKAASVPTTYQPILADRIYIKSLVEDVFGSRAMLTDSARILLNTAEFGAPCSAYESYIDLKGRLVNSMQNCNPFSATRLNSTVLPNPSSARQALLSSACSDWVHSDSTMRFAIARIGKGIPKATESNVQKLYHLFYRNSPAPSASLIQSLQLILKYKGTVSYANWRSAFYTVCASPHWQLL